ncbi:MAG: cytochrome P450, partial [Chloroflexi bacterium]|nr:cytochrome P450 [Chloroflexota bacterium]
DPPKPSVDRAALPPGPSELPLIGQARRLRGDLIGLLQECATYGDVSTVSVNPLLICLVNHPELNREVLVTNHQKTIRGRTAFEVLCWLMGNSVTTANGAYHLKQRRLIQPQFHRRRIENYAEIMTDFAAHRSDNWSDGVTLDIEEEMRELTLRIIVKALFGVELPDAVRRIGEAFEQTNDYMYLRLTQPPFLRGFLHSVPLPSSRRFKRARAYLDETVFGMIKERRQSEGGGDDLLSLLLEARYEDATGEENDRMSDEQVRDEVISLYIAGHDTTATTLTWSFYLLSKHPEIEARFHAEVDDVLGGRPATLDDLPNLAYTEQIITEVLRLYPPFWSLGRMVYEPFELGGHEIPPGVNLIVSPLITQRDARWFDAPAEFRPERWTDEFRGALPQYAYMPFGGGPHKCIGEGFAWMEAKIALATMGQHWRAHHDPRHSVVMQPHISLTPKGGMPVTLERRTKSSSV